MSFLLKVVGNPIDEIRTSVPAHVQDMDPTVDIGLQLCARFEIEGNACGKIRFAWFVVNDAATYNNGFAAFWRPDG
jgi:hypothetical protein